MISAAAAAIGSGEEMTKPADSTRRRRRRCRCLLLLPALLALAGCGSLLSATTADVAGIAGAGVAGAVTRSPAIATGIGLGIAAAAQGGLQYAERGTHSIEQERIAAAAGPLAPGVVGRWNVGNRLPVELAQHGEVVVTRTIGDAALSCKEIVFSTDKAAAGGQPQQAFYTATVCRDGSTWRWASAEPATTRWGSLQ